MTNFIRKFVNSFTFLIRNACETRILWNIGMIKYLSSHGSRYNKFHHATWLIVSNFTWSLSIIFLPFSLLSQCFTIRCFFHPVKVCVIYAREFEFNICWHETFFLSVVSISFFCSRLPRKWHATCGPPACTERVAQKTLMLNAEWLCRFLGIARRVCESLTKSVFFR